MPRNVFSVPIFFIVFRETLEAAIIVSVLLSLVEQIVHQDPALLPGVVPPTASTSTPAQDNEGSPHEKSNSSNSNEVLPTSPELTSGEEPSQMDTKRILRKMRIYIFAGAFLGLFIALAIGAAFIAVWFTQASNLWAKSEELWEGIFEFIASIIIFIMGISMLKMDRAKAKWRVKLQRSFAGKAEGRGAKTGKYVLFILPLVQVWKPSSLSAACPSVNPRRPSPSPPSSASSAVLTTYVVFFTNSADDSHLHSADGLHGRHDQLPDPYRSRPLLQGRLGLPGERLQPPIHAPRLGADVDDAGGDGPGSFDVRGSVWHLNCCNPENNFDSDGWSIFSAIFGWTNSATVGSVLAYVFYWLAVVVVLVYNKYREGRTTVFGKESAMGRKRRVRQETRDAAEAEAEAEK